MCAAVPHLTKIFEKVPETSPRQTDTCARRQHACAHISSVKLVRAGKMLTWLGQLGGWRSLGAVVLRTAGAEGPLGAAPLPMEAAVERCAAAISSARCRM